MAGIEIAVEAALRYIIKRPRLTRLLDNAKSRVLTLIAPAGFGKTTLAREWVEDRPHLWYRGTAATADVAALAAQLAEVVSAVIPDAGTRMLHRMRATGTPEQDVDILAELFAEDLAEWPGDTWLVFDDYQFAMGARAPERFVDLLLRKSPIQLLVTSRKRPSWASARRLLYGEVFELGRNELAMDPEEAAAVLAHRTGASAAGLVALAEGWPAVIGLAALAEDFELPKRGLPSTLYDYFAEELYQAASADVQRGLCRLALAPSLVDDVPQFLLGDDTAEVVGEGIRLGFLTGRPGALELHPLLRTFLEEKAREDAPASSADAERLARRFAELGLWDDAFPLVERFFSEGVFVALLESGLPALLDGARFSTLTRWLHLARTRRVDAAVVDLAEAEVAFRGAKRKEAEALALRVTRRSTQEPRLVSRAFYIAGMSAHMDFHNDRAKTFFDSALATAVDLSTRRDATWGKLTVSLDLDSADVSDLHAQLLGLDDGTAISEIRLALARCLTAGRTGGSLHDVSNELESARPLLGLIDDPHVISSYRHSSSYISLLRGDYAAALAESIECERYAKDLQLEFLLAHARKVRAAAELGLRHFGRCKQLIDWLDREATARHDIFLQLEGKLTRARLLISQGQAVEGARILKESPSRYPYEGERGEWLATRALALASMGDPCAIDLVEEASEIARTVEVKAHGPLVRAVLAVATNKVSAEEEAHRAFQTILELGNTDPFVVSYRGCPTILRILAHSGELGPELAVIMRNARDWSLAQAYGLATPTKAPTRGAALSPREQEVVELVSQGLTNKEIGNILFISEATAKVHVRHVLEKLGVRTRTEAAVRASGFAGGD